MVIDMENLLDAVRHVESGGNPNAVSSKGAQGPYQLMPDTAKELGVQDPFNEEQARAGAKAYLGKLVNQFGGSVEKAIAAYNGGPGRMEKVGNIAQMPQESRDYLSKVMQQYGANIVNKNAATTAALDSQNQPVPANDSLFPGQFAQRQQASDNLFNNNHENDVLSASVLNSQPVDKAARIYNMQLKTGLPAGVIERNLDDIEQKAKQNDFDAEAFRRQSPELAQWLAENPTRAALAQGDYENLSALEKSWATLQAIPAGVKEGVQQERMNILDYKRVTGEITPQEEQERQGLKNDIQESSQQNTVGAPDWVKSAASIVGVQAPMALEAAKKGVQFGVPMGALAGAGLGLIGGPGAPVSVPAGAAMGGLVGFKAAGAASYIDQTYRMSVGSAYDYLENVKDADGNPINPTAARYASLLVAVPNSILQFASLRSATKLIPGAEGVIGRLTTQQMGSLLARPSVTAALAKFGSQYAGTVGTFTFVSGMQQFMDIVARELATGDMGKGVTKQDASDISEASKAGFKGAVVLGALASGPKVIELHANMEKAAMNEQFMHNLGDIAANSETFKRSPEAFGEYVKQLKENGPVKNVYIPIESWNTLFQDKAPDAAKEVFGDLKQYQEAQATGGDLVVPIETYAQKLAGTPFHEKLVPNIRLNPGEMTPLEAKHAEDAGPQILDGLKKEVIETAAKQAPLNDVYKDVYGKLRDAGIGESEAERDAILTRERVGIRAERLGVDPLTLYNEKPLIVQREYPKVISDKLNTYTQSLVEQPVANPDRLPLEGGKMNLSPPTVEESTAARSAIESATRSERDSGVYGATIHLAKGDMSGTEGVAVAGYPQRGVVTEGKPTKANIETFLSRNRDIFKADKNAALGVWVDHESGKGYLDITNALPRDLAIAQGESLGEKAVWDLGKYEEIRLPTKGESGQGMLFNQKHRGASIPSQNLIALLKGADQSTFIHESGHLWLEELRTDAMRPDAPEQLKADWETIKDWSGAKDDVISKQSHETFAKGIEKYFMEGKSPSFALREVFAQFKDWLTHIYKTLNALDVGLTPEVRNVMDRLIASDEAIKATYEHGEYDTKLLTEHDMTKEEFKAYTDMNIESKRTAEDSFRAKVMKQLTNEKLQAWRDEKKALEPAVRNDILSTPIYRAAYWLWGGILPDGSKIAGMDIHRLDKQSLVDMGADLKTLAGRYQENGIHPDVAARMFGFTSGDSLVKALSGLPNLRSAIDTEVTRRMTEAHSIEQPTLSDAQLEVQNRHQVGVFNMELRVLKRLGAQKEIADPMVMKDIARQIISRKKIGELDPRVFEEAGLKAGQEAQDAMLGKDSKKGNVGRDLDGAFDAKQKQMLNLYLSREATEQKQMVDKSVARWTKFLARKDDRLAKTHDMNLISAARAIASVHGIGSAGDTAAAYMKVLAQYDPETYNDMREMVDMAASDGRHVDDLTVADFGVIKDTIEGLWTLARRTRQVEIDGKKLEKYDVVGQLTTRIGELVPEGKQRAGYHQAVSKWDKTKMGFLGLKAMLRRTEHWVDAMDDGDPNGKFRSYIWQPISEAADAYRDARIKTLTEYEKIVKSIPKDTFSMDKIDAHEIKYTFANKVELLGALLHTGNDSNKQKLLIGRDWGVFGPDGELDSRSWDRFIDRAHAEGILTADDYKFVQGVWDLMEGLKADAQKAHKDMYGFHFNEVTARPIKTPFGEYRGGYYPAIVDSFMVEDAAIRAEKAAMESAPNSYMFPTTGRGFTKQRSEMYAKPLSLDLGLIPSHIGKVLRFTHIEPHTKDVGRVMIDKGFRDHLSQLDSEVGAGMLMPWLQRSAQQLVEQPSGPRMQMFDKFFHTVRVNTGLQIIASNVSVALQQLGGGFISMTKVGPRDMAGALWRYTSSPADYTAHINESSSFMRNRIMTQSMDIQRSIDNIMLNPSKYRKAKDFMQQHGYFMQSAMQNIVDTVTWGAAYEKATRNGYDEKSAVRQADSAVRETQGTFSAEDLSKVETGTPLMKTATMFYSFFNMAANLNATEFAKAMRLNGFAAGGRGLYVYAMGFMLPAVIAEAITQAVSGDLFDPEDDGYLDNILSVFFGGQAKMATAMVPLIGSVAQAGINMYNNKWYDDDINVSPVTSSLKATASIFSGFDAYKLATDDNARLKRPIHDALTTIGLATGLPIGPLAKPISYMTDIHQGVIQEPDNPVEYARGLISGRAPK